MMVAAGGSGGGSRSGGGPLVELVWNKAAVEQSKAVSKAQP